MLVTAVQRVVSITIFILDILYIEHNIKSVFSKSSTFSKTIFNFLVRFPVILLLEKNASMKLREIQQENGRFFFEYVLL